MKPRAGVEWSHRPWGETCKSPSGKDQKDNLYHGRQKRGLCGRGRPVGSQENVIVGESTEIILWHFPHSLPNAPGTLISNVLPFSEARPAAVTIEGRGEGALMKPLPSPKPVPPRSIQPHSCEQRQEEAAKASCHHQTANENQGVCKQKLPASSPSNDHPGEYKFENVYYSTGTRLPQRWVPTEACFRDDQPKWDAESLTMSLPFCIFLLLNQ